MPFLETKDDTRLFYKDWGTGKPIIFICSWAVSSKMWEYQMYSLISEGHRCISYDRRGHGLSDDPGRGFDYDTLADDLSSLIEYFDLREITLVAHSMGCGEIVRFLTRHGSDRIDQVVFLAGSLPFPLKTADNPDGMDINLIETTRGEWKKDFPRWLAESEPSFFGAGLPNCSVSPQIGEWTRWDMLQTSLKAVLDCYSAIIETDFRDEMREITVPALIIHGDSDQSMPIEISGRKSAQLIPDNQFIVYENCPHGLYITHAERLKEDILSFIMK
ncbi:alpha/beta fold hydrolase [Pseudalkalibacillus decolorationis]|uniref:alpha/beta fold hydrolase n=1 Tax=Pseudalkalibacillus decolorationis TaxID=163879 RepID=UPI0021491DD7|nr:alpha/beta hydrolase [Pseudalkalibacillus decolorationis]